ncbi:MAG: hypothetical protein ABI134_30000, partial [Byssovorax sp.]
MTSLSENGGQLFAKRTSRKHWTRARLILGANMEHEPRPRMQVTEVSPIFLAESVLTGLAQLPLEDCREIVIEQQPAGSWEAALCSHEKRGHGRVQGCLHERLDLWPLELGAQGFPTRSEVR